MSCCKHPLLEQEATRIIMHEQQGPAGAGPDIEEAFRLARERIKAINGEIDHAHRHLTGLSKALWREESEQQKPAPTVEPPSGHGQIGALGETTTGICRCL